MEIVINPWVALFAIFSILCYYIIQLGIALLQAGVRLERVEEKPTQKKKKRKIGFGEEISEEVIPATPGPPIEVKDGEDLEDS